MRTLRNLLGCLPLLTLPACLGFIDRYSGRSEACEILAIGLPAQARVLGLVDTGISINDDPVVEFVLDVDAAGARWEARSRALISRLDLAAVQPGRLLPARYDPADRTRVALDLWTCPTR